MWLPRFVCPECGQPLADDGEGGCVCTACAAPFPLVRGIFRFYANISEINQRPRRLRVELVRFFEQFARFFPIAQVGRLDLVERHRWDRPVQRGLDQGSGCPRDIGFSANDAGSASLPW